MINLNAVIIHFYFHYARMRMNNISTSGDLNNPTNILFASKHCFMFSSISYKFNMLLSNFNFNVYWTNQHRIFFSLIC